MAAMSSARRVRRLPARPPSAWRHRFTMYAAVTDPEYIHTCSSFSSIVIFLLSISHLFVMLLTERRCLTDSGTVNVRDLPIRLFYSLKCSFVDKQRMLDLCRVEARLSSIYATYPTITQFRYFQNKDTLPITFACLKMQLSKWSCEQRWQILASSNTIIIWGYSFSL